MHFDVLPELLHPIASEAWSFFRSNRGASKRQIERPLPSVNIYVPTIWGQMPTGRLVAIEVTDVALPKTFGDFVHQCRNDHIPVQVYIAMPDEAHVEQKEFNRRFAIAHNLGFLTVNESKTCFVDREALSLSLAGVRSIPLPTYPRRFREPLAEAEATYQNGNANKGVSQIWDQVEFATRAVALATFDRGWWKNPPTIDIATGNWYPLMQQFHAELNGSLVRPVCPDLKPQLIAKVMGASGDRNLSAHEPKTPAARTQRDLRLRTLFESAFDLFGDLLVAAKPLKIKY